MDFMVDENSTKMTFFVDKIVELSRIRRNRRRFCPFSSNNRRRDVSVNEKGMPHKRHPLLNSTLLNDLLFGVGLVIRLVDKL